MADPTKLFQGAAALRKGIAMFSWFVEVEAALKEVPELEKHLSELKENIHVTIEAWDSAKNELAATLDEKTGVDAKAKEIREAAEADAKKILDGARAHVDAVVADTATWEKAERERIDKEAKAHEEFMKGAEAEAHTLQVRVNELNAELAAIKERL